MAAISFLSDAESVYESDTVTPNKRLFFNGLQERYLGVTMPSRGFEWLTTRNSLPRLKNFLVAIISTVRNRCVSCCVTLPISFWIIPERPRKSTRLRQRSSDAQKISILI